MNARKRRPAIPPATLGKVLALHPPVSESLQKAIKALQRAWNVAHIARAYTETSPTAREKHGPAKIRATLGDVATLSRKLQDAIDQLHPDTVARIGVLQLGHGNAASLDDLRGDLLRLEIAAFAAGNEQPRTNPPDPDRQRARTLARDLRDVFAAERQPFTATYSREKDRPSFAIDVLACIAGISFDAAKKLAREALTSEKNKG